MITEDYISFEVAKLLKEKGFNNPCLRVYDNKGIICIRYTGFDVPHDYFNRQLYLCSTHQMAMKWLREKQIYIRIIEDAFGKSFRFEVYSKNPNVKINYYIPNYYIDTYKDAVEAALKYCLENLL